MRNSKVKGFTLIELIVVIAIIGVLAAILVPSMLGFVRTSRISTANANAKLVHTAATASLTQCLIADQTPANGSVTGGGTMTAAWGSYTANFATYLGANFQGTGSWTLDPTNTSILYANWVRTGTPVGTQVSAATQETNAAAGTIEGCYPLLP